MHVRQMSASSIPGSGTGPDRFRSGADSGTVACKTPSGLLPIHPSIHACRNWFSRFIRKPSADCLSIRNPAE
ncbi:MAG: hypothetical protein J6V24_10575, partial [Clostridia bacterium]|nr:hypothetical protein [Clostridia bacterium]